MKILVTGAEGFLGTHLVRQLHADGHDLTTCDIKKGCDLRVEGERWGTYDVVYHLAAVIEDVQARMRSGIRAYQNIALDLCMAEYLERNPPKIAYVHVSSCAVDNLDDPYGVTKFVGEKFCHALYKSGVEVVILRPFSGYGSDQSKDYPFRAILGRVLRGDDPVVVWGSGTQVRDWVHVDDLVRAFLLAPDSFPRNVPVELGTGVATSFLSLAEKMVYEVYRSRKASPEPEIVNDATKETSSRWRTAKTGKAAEHGWEAKITLFQGINRIVRELQEVKHES